MFFLEFDEQTVLPYLRDLPLSRLGRLRIARFMRELQQHLTTYLNDPTRRRWGDGPHFEVDYLYGDGSAYRRHYLVLSDSAAQFGVVRVVYVEDTAGPPRSQ